MKTWADRIEDLKKLGWSITELAGECGISPQALSDVHKGRSTEPRGMAAVRLFNLHAERRPPAPKRRKAA